MKNAALIGQLGLAREATGISIGRLCPAARIYPSAKRIGWHLERREVAAVASFNSAATIAKNIILKLLRSASLFHLQARASFCLEALVYSRLTKFLSSRNLKSMMANADQEFMLQILDDLSADEIDRFKFYLNTKEINGKVICKSKLQDSRAENMAKLLMSYHTPKHLEALRDTLAAIPRKDLVIAVSDKIVVANKEHENQTEEVDGIPGKKLKFSELPPYEGTFSLSDMDHYAAEYQDLLIKELEKHLEHSAFKLLKEQLYWRTLKNNFSFTSSQYYSLVTNQDLRSFLRNVTANQKAKNIPPKILEILFSHNKSNKKREAVAQIQHKANVHSNLRSAQRMTQPREKNPITSSPLHCTDERKPGNEMKELLTNKEKRNAQISKEDISTKNDNIHYDEKRAEEGKESPASKQKGSAQSSTFTKDLDVDCDEKRADEGRESPARKQTGNAQSSKEDTIIKDLDVDYDEQRPEDERKDSPINKKQENFLICPRSFVQDLGVVYNERGLVCESKKDTTYNDCKKNDEEVPKNDQYDVLARAVRKHYGEKRAHFNLVCFRQHKKYNCFIVLDTLLFRLPEETKYRILRSLQDKKDLTNKGQLRKNVEFELQFNMAVLDVQISELISDNTFQRVQAQSFGKYEEDLEHIVSVIVLPLLALYKSVKLKTLQGPGTTKDILLPGVEQQMATEPTQIDVCST